MSRHWVDIFSYNVQDYELRVASMQDADAVHHDCWCCVTTAATGPCRRGTRCLAGVAPVEQS
jgi:hypothetical protein